MYVFKIYVVSPPRGTPALATGLERALGGVLDAGEFSIEVVNVLEYPDRAVADGILVTPTIIRESPEPGTRVTGNCSDMLTVLARLGLAGKLEPCLNA